MKPLFQLIIYLFKQRTTFDLFSSWQGLKSIRNTPISRFLKWPITFNSFIFRLFLVKQPIFTDFCWVWHFNPCNEHWLFGLANWNALWKMGYLILFIFLAQSYRLRYFIVIHSQPRVNSAQGWKLYSTVDLYSWSND